MKKEEPTLRNYVKDKESQRIFEQVFDKTAIETLHSLASKGFFDGIEFVISTGKEAHVFRAVDNAGNHLAVKIYKIETSDFKNMSKYIEGDIRFKRVKQNKRDLVYAWTRKEFRNLLLANKAGVNVPMPIAFKNNVLVMEFIGDKGNPSPTLKEKPPEDSMEFHKVIVDYIARMLFKGEIIHADLSEYNILNTGEVFTVIDVGQAVLTSHPCAKEFFERDVRNIAGYLHKIGEKTSFEELYAEIKHFEGKFLKKQGKSLK